MNNNGKDIVSNVWGNPKLAFFYKKFCGGFQRDTYSAVLRNTLGDDTSFEALYAVLALQMLPHAVGFYKRAPWPPEAPKSSDRVL
jgi:hypothetical protein